jgi:hypothetical protein
MTKKLRFTLGPILLVVGALCLSLSAKPSGSERGPEPPRLDVAGAAATFGVEEEALAEALGLPAGGPDQRPADGEHGRPDLTAAAEALGVTEEALRGALGEPGQGRPDFAAASATLGMPEDALIEALRVPGPEHERPEHPQLRLEEAAEWLGVSADDLAAALGLPNEGPQQAGPGGPP